MDYANLHDLARGRIVFLKVNSNRILIAIDYGNEICYYYKNSDFMDKYLKIGFDIVNNFFNLI
jgi:hypothetical protein